jgi:hypothetical protein
MNPRYDDVLGELEPLVFGSPHSSFVLHLNLALMRQELRFLWTIVNDQMHSELQTESESPSRKTETAAETKMQQD